MCLGSQSIVVGFSPASCCLSAADIVSLAFVDVDPQPPALAITTYEKSYYAVLELFFRKDYKEYNIK